MSTLEKFKALVTHLPLEHDKHPSVIWEESATQADKDEFATIRQGFDWSAEDLRYQMVKDVDVWYLARLEEGVTVQHNSEDIKLRANTEAQNAFTSLILGESLDVEDTETTTTDADQTLLLDFYGAPMYLTIAELKKLLIQYKNAIKTIRMAALDKVQEILTADVSAFNAPVPEGAIPDQNYSTITMPEV